MTSSCSPCPTGDMAGVCRTATIQMHLAEQLAAADALQRPLMPCSRFQAKNWEIECFREHSRFFVTRRFSRMKREYRTAEQGISNYEVFLPFDIHNSLFDIRFSRIRKCKQIMYNLPSNALKYTPEYGTVDVIISKEW
ncbi:hypothetical protein [uncultured Candidatus Kuenenia sp.]|nr:hypothetical protein [uncultured Candidatus Kuenenia sp.]